MDTDTLPKPSHDCGPLRAYPSLPASLILWTCDHGHEVYSKRTDLLTCPAFDCGQALTPKGRRTR